MDHAPHRDALRQPTRTDPDPHVRHRADGLMLVASVRSGLDTHGNGIACDDLPRGGFAPTWWTDAIPAGAVEAQVVSVTDGDTLNVTINGQPNMVRLYRADTIDPAQVFGIADA